MRFYLIPFLFLAACTSVSEVANTDIDNKQVSTNTPPITKAPYSSQQEIEDTEDFNFATYYVVAIDTGVNYANLLSTMEAVRAFVGLKIDSLGRYYNTKKDLICLPDDDADEIYRGEYYPRRYASEFLSIEYYTYFSENSHDKNMVIIAGIYENPQRADSLLTVVKKEFPKSFSKTSKIYVGCMH